MRIAGRSGWLGNDLDMGNKKNRMLDGGSQSGAIWHYQFQPCCYLMSDFGPMCFSSQMRKEAPPSIPLSERAALTPAEFAAYFGHEQTWAYRQVYAGRVKIISDMGKMMIPRSELERVQGLSKTYAP